MQSGNFAAMDLETFVNNRSALPAVDRGAFDTEWASSLTDNAMFDAIREARSTGNKELVALLASHIADRIRDPEPGASSCRDCVYAAIGLPLLVLSFPVGVLSMLFCGLRITTPCMQVHYPSVWGC